MISASPFEPFLERSAHYPGIDRSSLYLNMRDGVRLAMDVYLPRGLPTGVKLPTLLIQTRYWRSVAARPPISWFVADMQDLHPVIGGIKKFFVQHGYAIVYLDVRGTGASTGVLYYPWQPACLDDAYQVVDWIVSQTWSNGKVGGLGVSYMGTTAELLAATGHPAVKAVVPMFNHPDPYTDITLPGGSFNARFIREWSEMDVYLDSTPRKGPSSRRTRPGGSSSGSGRRLPPKGRSSGFRAIAWSSISVFARPSGSSSRRWPGAPRPRRSRRAPGWPSTPCTPSAPRSPTPSRSTIPSRSIRRAALEDVLSQTTMPSPDASVIEASRRACLDDLLPRLPARQRQVIVFRYGLDGSPPCSLATLAEYLGVSRERVHQIEQDAWLPESSRQRAAPSVIASGHVYTSDEGWNR